MLMTSYNGLWILTINLKSTMKPFTYLKNTIKRYKSNPYFDVREHKGCSEDEINQIKKLLAPHFQRIPLAIEDDLRYYGKFRQNEKGIYLQMLEAVEDGGVDLEKELDLGFWVLADGHFGVFTDNSSYLSQFIDNGNLDDKDYDDPPYCHKTGDKEDNDLNVHICLKKYSERFHYSKDNDFLKNYNQFYPNNLTAYKFKQLLVDFYSEIEDNLLRMTNEHQKRYNYLVTRIRLNLADLPYRRLSGIKKEILYQIRLANKGDFEELTKYSDKIDSYYTQLKDFNV